MKNSDKVKISVWIEPSLLEEADRMVGEDDSRNRSEFITKAIRAYLGYIYTKDGTSMLPNYFLSSLKAMLSQTDTRFGRMLFKVAVELAMVQNILASIQEIDPVSLERLRGECVKEVKRTNGGFTMEDAMQWQNG